MKRRKLLISAFVVLAVCVQAQPLRKVSRTNLSPQKELIKASAIESVADINISKVPANKAMVAKNKAKAPATITAAPNAAYSAPQGTLYYGISSPGGYLFNSVLAVAPAYSEWNFKNLTVSDGSPVFQWSISESGGATTTSTETDFNFSVQGPSEYTLPVLGATLAADNSTFSLGSDISKTAYTSYIYSAGTTENLGGETYEVGNWLPDLGFANWMFDVDDFIFGTGSTGANDALVNYFEKPATTLYFEGVNFFLGTFSAPANTEFTLRIITVEADEDGQLKFNDDGSPVIKDTVAASYAYTEDVIDNFVLPFTNLVAIGALGLETEIPYLELDDPFIVELSGFNVSGVKLSVFSTGYSGFNNTNYPIPAIAYDINHAYTYYYENGGRFFGAYSNTRASLLTTLIGGTYSFLVSTEDSITANVNGGIAEFTLDPFFNNVWLEEDAPSWITVEQAEHYDNSNWGTDIKLTYEALPSGVTGRKADIIFKTWGAKAVITVEQGEVSTTTSSTITRSTKVVNTGSEFILTYPGEFTSVELYNIAGQAVNRYELPVSGTFSIPASNLSSGVYVVKFNGSKTETVKVIR